MIQTEIGLTEQERHALQEISRRTGKTESELLHEAIEHFIARFRKEGRQSLMQAAKGIWKDRQDLPTRKALRREWDRF